MSFTGCKGYSVSDKKGGSFLVGLPNGAGLKQFKSLEEFKHWLQEELAYWRFLAPVQPQTWGLYTAAIEEILRLEPNEVSYLPVVIGEPARLDLGSARLRQLILRDSPKGEFIQGLRASQAFPPNSQDAEALAGAATAMLVGYLIEGHHHPSTYRGIQHALAYLSGGSVAM